MKKTIMVLLTVFLFISCSSTKKIEINSEKQYEILLNNWELEKLDLTLKDSENFQDKEVLKKYKNLLQEKIKEKSALEEMMKKIKIQLENNDFEGIELYFDDSFINRKILSELKKTDFSQMKIVYGKPEFYKDSAKNIVAVIYMDNVEYFQFNYKLKNKKWSIMEIKNGR